MEPPSLIEAIEMLTQGRGLAFQLRDLFQLDDQTDDRLVLAEDLLEKIHGSFTDSISALDLACESAEMKSEESGRESSKATTFANTRKAASNSKRSKMSQGETWTEVASTLIHDGHAWRKYGQKPILNAKHSRSYYKCTHKDDSGCPAKKHVQQTGDDPCSYRTVYSFRHTCTGTTNNPLTEAGQMILESATQPDMNPSSSIILNFQSNQHHSDHNNNAFLSSELNQEHTTSPHTANHCSIEYSPYVSYSQDAEDPWFS